MRLRNGAGLACVLGFVFVGSAFGVTRYVNSWCPNPSAPYVTWVTAATNIQQAIDVANDGDEILVAPGEYRIRVDVLIPSSKRLTLHGTVGRDAIIDAQRLCRGMTIEGTNSLVEGFTIRNGLNYTFGGGIYLSNASTVRDCLVTGNESWEGGGIYVKDAFCLVENSTIQSNLAHDLGGGVCLTTGTVNNCEIRGNVASNYGGGVYFDGAGTVSNSWISDNRAVRYDGGGADMEQGGRLINSVVVGNGANRDGGGIFGWRGFVAHCTVSSNTAAEKGGGMHGSESTVWNSILYYNSAPTNPNSSGSSIAYSYCCATENLGGANFTNAPRFVKRSVRDFRLASGSPCIDAGATNPAVNIDYLGYFRPLSGIPGSPARYDVGAYEYEPDWDEGYESIGAGWRRLAWFGDYVPMGGEGWIWHNRHGFFFVPANAVPESIWLYAQDMGWLWTGYGIYPYLYRASDGVWLWYNGATNPRWFRNMTANTWESRP